VNAAEKPQDHVLNMLINNLPLEDGTLGIVIKVDSRVVLILAHLEKGGHGARDHVVETIHGYGAIVDSFDECAAPERVDGVGGVAFSVGALTIGFETGHIHVKTCEGGLEAD